LLSPSPLSPALRVIPLVPCRRRLPLASPPHRRRRRCRHCPVGVRRCSVGPVGPVPSFLFRRHRLAVVGLGWAVSRRGGGAYVEYENI
jgi:hypothetical protein